MMKKKKVNLILYRKELAEWIENSLIALVDKNGFYEYYDPDSGKSLGEKDFSWTAPMRKNKAKLETTYEFIKLYILCACY